LLDQDPHAPLSALLVAASSLGTTSSARVPLVCTRGPSGQVFTVAVTAPATQAPDTTYRVRIDEGSSGQVSHTGLNYIFDMETDYLLPDGASFVEGSARVVSGTGTANVREGARAWRDAGGIHLLLPAHVENGGTYTPPSIEFDLKVTAPPRSVLEIKLSQYRVKANAFLVGDLRTTCDPTPRPFRLAQTVVTSPPDP